MTLSSKRRFAAAAVLLLLILFLVRPGVSRLKNRIANSIERAVDRPVEIGAVHLRFLPRPGFDLDNLVIYEDPAFGAEPMLRAPEVTAVVRFGSLLRGRVEISRLELTEPSLNLVRRKEDGHWNWASLLERTRRSPLAPTAKSKSEPRPGFPYIEASSGRINFKSGPEKKPYALLDADFALWQESDNAWGVRLKAQPTRTDMTLSDTGLLRITGTWQRASSLFETPLQFTAEWNNAQLGQMTKLVSGADKGWRGDSRLAMTLRGSPSALQIGVDGSIRGFHRYDIPTSDALAMTAHCDGKYNAAGGTMREIFCSGPVGNGLITLKGEAGAPGSRLLNLTLNLDGVPANSVAQLVRRAKKGLPTDLIATGSVRGNFSIRQDGVSPPEFEGSGEVLALRLQSASNNVGITPGNVPFVLSSEQPADRRSGRKFDRQPNTEPLLAGEARLEYGPFALALGRTPAVQAQGWLARSGYGLSLRGEGEIAQTLRLAGLFGVPALKTNATGIAQMDLQIAGSWSGNRFVTGSGFSAPSIVGTVQLHNLRATAHGLRGPMEISSAELNLSPAEARIDKLNARAVNAHWTGSITMPRGCGAPDACLIHFNLNADEVEIGALYGWLGSHPGERHWYQVLSSEPDSPSILRSLRTSGNLSVSRLLVHHLPIDHVSAALNLDRGKLDISNLRFDVLGGKHSGEWQADFAGPAPTYKGSGTLTNVSLQQAADAMHNSWISGKATASYALSSTGKTSSAFWQSAEGDLHFDIQDAVFPHISLPTDNGPLRVSNWQGAAHLQDGKIEIPTSKIASSSNIYAGGGSATLGQALNLKLSTASKRSTAHPVTYNITGTISKPLVTQVPALEAQARLKQ